MDMAVFQQFCAEAKTLTVAQIRQLGEVLQAMDARIDLLSRIDERRAAISECPACKGTSLGRWGQTRTGLQRLRCRGCHMTFSSASGTAVDRIRKPEKFHRVVADMFSTVPQSCRKLGEELGLDKMTIWRWRHRIIQAMLGVGATDLSGIVEADEKFFRESRKGSREWVNHFRNPTAYPAPPRARWEDYRRMRARNNVAMRWLIPVLTVVDRSGGRRADVLPSRARQPLLDCLDEHIGQHAVLCSDGDPIYQAFASGRGIPHYALNTKTGPRLIANAFHIQTINSLHDRFERFMEPFRGPATKNLPAYTAWFIARLVGGRGAAANAAWQRMLAP